MHTRKTINESARQDLRFVSDRQREVRGVDIILLQRDAGRLGNMYSGESTLKNPSDKLRVSHLRRLRSHCFIRRRTRGCASSASSACTSTKMDATRMSNQTVKTCGLACSSKLSFWLGIRQASTVSMKRSSLITVDGASGPTRRFDTPWSAAMPSVSDKRPACMCRPWLC